VKEFPADSSGLANLALAHFYLRDMKSARDFGQQASKLSPRNVIQRNNVALFAMYSGDFETAERIANEALALNPGYEKAFVAMALSQLAVGRTGDAAATYSRLAELTTARAKSLAAAGRIDLALYDGRQEEALTLLDAALAADLTAGNRSAHARRLAIKAGILAEQGKTAAAIRAAKDASAAERDEGTQYLAARALILARDAGSGLEIATALDNKLEDEPRIYGALLRGEAALAAGRAREAIEAFESAQKLDDTWLGRCGLGRAYLALRAYPEAVQEFDRCLTRKGEATAVFLDDLPTYHLIPRVNAFLGQARAAMAPK
jgi:tetratricopeptide (TPR) repeat protein